MSKALTSKPAKAFTPTEMAAAKGPQPHRDLGSLYTLAATRQTEFHDIPQGVSKRLGGTVHDPTVSRTMNHDIVSKPGAHVIIAPLKGRARAAEKVGGKYGGDASRISDLVRGTVAVQRVQDIPSAIQAVRDELPKGWTITAPENRFVKGPDGDRVNTGDLNGYRDISVLLRAPDGFQSELQINTTHMVATKNEEGHALYEERRRIAEQPGQRTAMEEHRMRILDESAKHLYDGALERSLGRTRAPVRS